jgi:hypothetical protein
MCEEYILCFLKASLGKTWMTRVMTCGGDKGGQQFQVTQDVRVRTWCKNMIKKMYNIYFFNFFLSCTWSCHDEIDHLKHISSVNTIVIRVLKILKKNMYFFFYKE